MPSGVGLFHAFFPPNPPPSFYGINPNPNFPSKPREKTFSVCISEKRGIPSLLNYSPLDYTIQSIPSLYLTMFSKGSNFSLQSPPHNTLADIQHDSLNLLLLYCGYHTVHSNQKKVNVFGNHFFNFINLQCKATYLT